VHANICRVLICGRFSFFPRCKNVRLDVGFELRAVGFEAWILDELPFDLSFSSVDSFIHKIEGVLYKRFFLVLLGIKMIE
jgi:hypothetical protein